MFDQERSEIVPRLLSYPKPVLGEVSSKLR
jgi:hypothetical protein